MPPHCRGVRVVGWHAWNCQQEAPAAWLSRWSSGPSHPPGCLFQLLPEAVCLPAAAVGPSHLIGMLPVGILTCSRANMALSDRMPFARLMSDTCRHREVRGARGRVWVLVFVGRGVGRQGAPCTVALPAAATTGKAMCTACCSPPPAAAAPPSRCTPHSWPSADACDTATKVQLLSPLPSCSPSRDT